MKELQNFVYRHMDALKHHKRYLAMLTALSMLVTFIVPLILVEPADSMTGILVCNKTVHTHNAECYVGDTLICDIEEHIHTGACYKKISPLKGASNGEESTTTPHADNENIPNAGGGQNEDGSYTSGNAHKFADGTGWYNPAELPLYTLLFGTGENHWVKPNLSLEQNLEIVDDEYFLGFASDFCAFIESDFTAFDADAEGRMFVGGDLIFKGIPNGKKWNYQVGAGDYGQFTPILQTDEYGHLSGFASAIIGGKVYRLATMTTGAFTSLSFDDGLPEGRTEARHTDGNDVMLYPEEGAYKRFVIGNLKDSLHYDEDGAVADIPYGLSCDHLYYKHTCSLCDGLTKDNKDNYKNNAHGYLGDVNELSQFYLYDDVRTILEKTFDTLRARSLSLASIEAREVKPSGGTLALDATNIGDAKTVYFKINNWEGIQRVVITVPDDRITYTESGDKEEKYSNNNKTIKNLDLNVIVSCGEEEIEITQSIPTYILAKTADEKPDDGYGYKISNRGKDDGANATNNHPVSSNILYNFYNATKVEFTGDTNFNGTIFAPNANVTAPETCRGHLSGALIAKSFYGGLEFGYRPYRGGVDIFGMVSGYAVPVNKVDQGGEVLPGALFAIKQDGKFVSLFESGDGTNFAALPSKVDFTGNTPYKPEYIEQTTDERPYVGSEIKGGKLTADVSFDLYKNYSYDNKTCSGEINVENNENILPKFYLDANQAVVFDANENFKSKLIDSDNHIYEIQLIKPVTSLTITARNQGNSAAMKEATINFIPMTLGVNKTEYTLNSNEDGINLTVSESPTNDTIYYKYFLNGGEISEGYNTEDTYNGYHPSVPGGATFSVSAYVKIGEEYYEIAQATAEKVNVKDFDYKNTKLVVSDSITSGQELEIKVDNLPNGAKIQYIFNGKEQTNGNFDTSEFVGKDLPVEAIITVGEGDNKKVLSLKDTVTVNFGTDIKFNDYNTTYDVNPYSNLDFYLENIEKYLNQVPNDKKTITFYFKDEPIQSENFNYAKIDQKLVGENMTVYAVITANGLEHRIYGKSVTGKYNDNLGLHLAQGPYIAGNSINVNVISAPEGAEVIFKAVDSNNNEIDLPDNPKTVSGGSCGSVFTPEKAGNYTIKAYLTFEGNITKELVSGSIPVSPKPVTGDLLISSNEVNTGTEVGLKVTNAPEDANVVFTVTDPNGTSTSLAGTYESGEYKNSFTPKLAGDYKVSATISKDGASKTTEEIKLKVNENTTVLDGKLVLSHEGTVKKGTSITVNVNNITNGAVLNLTVSGPTSDYSKEISEKITNGIYSYYFVANDVGTYTVTGTLSSGTSSYPLGVKQVTVIGEIDIVATGDLKDGKFVMGEQVTLSLNPENLPTGIARVDYYLDSLDSSNPIHTKNELNPERSDDNMSVTFTPGQIGTHNYTAKAYNDDGNIIATITESFETISPTYDNFTMSLDNPSYSIGDTVTVTLAGVPSNTNNIQPFLSDIGGVNNFTLVSDDNNGNRVYTFTAPTNINGDTSSHDLIFTAFLQDGSQAKTQITITFTKTTTVALSLRKYLSILEDENADTSDNKIVIKELDNDTRIENLRIAFPSDVDANNTYFKLEVKGNVGEPIYLTSANVTDSNPDYIDIPSSKFGDNLKEIEIIPIEGSITIDKCYPSYIKNENVLEQTSAAGFTLLEKEVKEIIIPNKEEGNDKGWVEALNSITFNLENEGTASIQYALVERAADGEEAKVSEFKEAKVENGNSIIISDLNAENIEKILVYTNSESLTIKDYTISGFIGDNTYSREELENLKNNDLDIINYYTLVEQQAPTGYFKEDTIYTIEVKETIKLDKLVQKENLVYPAVVYTTITAKGKDTKGKLVEKSYTIEISYVDDEGKNFDVNRRFVKILGENDAVVETFTLTRSGNGNEKTLTVEADNGVLDWDTTKPGAYEHDGKDYYFDPAAMMIVPVSNEPIKYTNIKGLLFRKVDDSGAIVKEVMIEMHQYNVDEGEWQEVPAWKWSKNETSECLLSTDGDNATIQSGIYYRFHESDAGGKYELTDDIYMVRVDENTIHYWNVDRDANVTNPAATKPEDYNVLDLTKDNIIRMSNFRIPGVKLSLSKTDLKTNSVIVNATQDAVFNLYADNGTLLLKDITVTNGKIELNLLGVTDSEGLYVEEGYLKPGTYFLREMKAPTTETSIYEASVSDFYFSVIVDDNGAYSIKSQENTPGVVKLNETQSDGTIHRVLKFQQKALSRLSELDQHTPVIQFKFNTNGGEMGYGNAKFSAIVNGETKSPETSAYPPGCDSHTNGISFQSEEVIVQLSVKQICDLFGVDVANFNNITDFSINCWNSTTISDIDFYPIENPIYYTNSSTQIMILESGLRRITDDMIKNENEILSITFKADKKGYTAKFYGIYTEGNKKETKNNSIECPEGSMTVKLTAKEMLKKIGVIGANDSITDEDLVTKFKNLSSFGADSWDGTQITSFIFNMPTDDTNETTPELLIPSITVDGTNVKVSNEIIGKEMKLRVEKKWAGDNGVTELRQPVKVTLMQKQGENGDYKSYNSSNAVQELSSENSWTYTWENLPRFVDDDMVNGEKYYYKVVEETPTGYICSVAKGYEEFNVSGTITLTNTANVIDIPVTKSWDFAGFNTNVVPDSVMFKLQARPNESSSWIDLPQKTIVLTKPNNWDGITAWEGKFEDLPVGYQYQVVEGNLPYAYWSIKEGSTTSTTAVKTDKEEVMESGFAVTNIYNPPKGELKVGKEWIGDTASDRPEQLKFKVYRTIAKPYYEESDAPYVEAGNDYKTDYERLLQHSLYFYDANMCGDDVSANSALAWRSNCHLEDEIPGGYHDAGDHVMFGLPQGYAASMLGWTYYEFFRGGGVKEVNEADKEHLKVILERFYDFFVNSVKYENNDPTKEISEILVQKGNGNKDHVEWVSPERQVSRANEMYWRDYGADIAAEYAAALAIGYRNFYNENGSEEHKKTYANYLEVAKKLYKFAADNPTPFNEWGVNKDETQQHKPNPGFYNSEGCNDDMAWAAGWLYLVTEDSYYLAESNKILNDKDFWGYSWNDVTLAALCVNAYINGKTDPWSDVRSAIDGKIGESYEKYFCQDSWGSARYNAIMQMAVLVAAKNGQNEVNYKKWATTQMGYILGNNTWNNGESVCLITSFSDNSTENAHHRAASGWDNLDDYKSHSTYNDAEKHALIGGMAGGPSFKAHDEDQMKNYGHLNLTDGRHGNYADDLHDYCCNEVSLDYNAGLVGAAAGLYYFTGTGTRSTMIEGVEIEAMGGTPEYTVAYAPSSIVDGTAYSLKPVEKQIGYNMVPFRRTAVSVLDDTTWNWSTAVAVNLSNVTGVKITFEWNGKGGFSFNSYDSSYKLQGSGGSCYEYETSITDPVEIADYKIDLNSAWEGAEVSIANVEFITQSTEFAFTTAPTDNSTHDLRQNITFKTNEAANWTASPNDSSIVQLTQSSDKKECTVKFLKYTDQAVTITATSSSDTSKAVSRTVKAKKATLSLDKSELEVGESVTFTVNNVTNDGITWEYYVNDEKLKNANNNPYTYTVPEAGDKSVYAVIKSGDVVVDTTAAQGFTVKAAIPKIDGASDMFEGESETYELDGATDWQISSGNENNIVSISSTTGSCTLSSIANVNENTTVQISAVLNGTTITKDVVIKAITISDQSMGTSETITVELGDVTGNYQWKVESETPDALGSISGDNAKCIINSSANTGSFIIGLYINDSNVTTNKLTQFTVNVADGAFNLVTDNNTTSIQVGENIYLRADDNRNNLRLEIVSGQNYVSVNQQNVYGLAPGTAKVVAIDQNNERSAPFTITVTELDMDLTGISNMLVGQQLSLSEQNNITNWNWSFSAAWSVINNDNVVSFNTNEKKITALNLGTFTLKVEIKYNQNNNNNIIAKTITREITVTPPPMTLSPNTAEIEVKGEIKLQPSNVPEGYTITSWESSHPDIAKVDENGNVIGVKASDTAVTITATATCEGEDEITATAQITVIPISVPEGYYLINAITPEDNKIVKDKDMDFGDMHAIVSDHAVDAILIEFEPVSAAFNGYVYWNKTWDENSKETNTSQFIYDQYRSDTNIADNKFLLPYTESLNLSSLGIMGKWGEGAGVIKSIKFLTKNLKPTILNAPTSMIAKNEVTLETVGFTNTDNIQWTVEGGNATIDNGVFKPSTQGTFIITATSGNQTASTTIVVARIPIKIGFNSTLDEVTKTVKYTEAVQLYQSENVTYEIVQNARIDVSSLITIDNVNDVVKVTDTTAFGTANVTVTIQGYVEEGGEKVVSNQIQVTFVGNHYITGISEISPYKSTKLKVENALGGVTWGVLADDDAYTIEVNNESGLTQYVVKDKKSEKIILTLDASTGKVIAGESAGMVVITAEADNAMAEYTIVVKDLPMKPIIPTEGKEFVKEVILTGANWSANLGNLPVKDEKGNIYYYYIEEYAYKKSASDEKWKEIYNAESLGFIHANGTYMPVSYNENGNSLIEGKTSSFTVGNKATEKPQGQLPSTGGSGVTTYYYLGGVIMLLSIAGFTGLKRRDRKRRKE